jgi:hypothetical protein
MNGRQETAFRFPCARGHETMSSRYWQREFIQARELSTILTVNK